MLGAVVCVLGERPCCGNATGQVLSRRVDLATMPIVASSSADDSAGNCKSSVSLGVESQAVSFRRLQQSPGIYHQYGPAGDARAAAIAPAARSTVPQGLGYLAAQPPQIKVYPHSLVALDAAMHITRLPEMAWQPV
jgi:hypothetical protein